jgi:ribonuclease HI
MRVALANVSYELQGEEKVKHTEKIAEKVIQIYADGSGCRPDGSGSGFAWLRKDTGEKKIVREDRLTNNQAEYRAILSAVEHLPSGSNADLRTDSENTCFQLRGERRILDPRLAELAEKIETVMREKRLSIAFTWIPRRENLAGKLL